MASCHHDRRASRFPKVVGIVDTSVATVTKGGRAGRKLTADKTTAAWPCDFKLHAISQAITTYGVAQGLPRKGILWQESKHRHGKFSQFIGGREGRRGGGSRRPWSSTGGGRQVAVAAGPGRRRARQGDLLMRLYLPTGGSAAVVCRRCPRHRVQGRNVFQGTGPLEGYAVVDM